jgi:uncharacterized membrane protein (DUF2068 family)
MVEASKGLLVVLAGFGLLALIHADVQNLAEDMVTHLHLNPSSHYPRIFIDLAAHLSDSRLWTLASLAFGYASLRFAEAGGLWFHRVWAEWLAALSGGIYVPFELYELANGVTVLKVATLSINLIIVAYMSRVLFYRYLKV